MERGLLKRVSVILIFILLGLAGRGQQDSGNLDGLLTSAEQWAKENLDDDALRVLPSADQEKVRQFLANIQKQFHGEYIADLGTLKGTAKAVLPLLENFEETLPYALWLKTRLDYLEVADQFRFIIPPPKPPPGQPPQRIPNPAPEKQREVWLKKLAERPWPKAAAPYVSRLKPIFAEQNVPPELVWVAEVESSFDPRARSPEGAIGLFQLMPATAKRYGLKTWPVDQRLQPEPSARTAAKYLSYLHNHFQDWRLALAAYNSGEGTVQELLKRHKAHTFDAIATHLPAETQLFVPKVEATILRREGRKLSELRAELIGALKPFVLSERSFRFSDLCVQLLKEDLGSLVPATGQDSRVVVGQGKNRGEGASPS